MIDPSQMYKTYSVATLDEVRSIEHSAQRRTLLLVVLRFCVWIYVTVANFAIRGIKFVAFPGRSQKINSVVVYSEGMLGDTVALLPTVESIRRHYAPATLSWVMNSGGFRANEVIDKSIADSVVLVNSAPIIRKGFRFAFSDSSLAALKCDVFINLSPLGNRGLIGSVLREMIFARRTGASIAAGFRLSSYGRRGILNQVQHFFVQNEPRRGNQVLRELGIPPAEHRDLLPRNREVQNAMEQQYLSGVKNKRIVLMNLGAKFGTKKWGTARFAEACKKLINEENAYVILAGTAEDAAAAESIVQGCPGGACSAAGCTSLQQLIELGRLADLCISNDTGTMHMTAMCGTPTIGLFTTRMSPAHWFPGGASVRVLFSFSPSTYSFDDGDVTHDSLASITVDSVVAAAHNVLSH